MAYVSPELKAKASALVKAATPKGWKITLRVRHHSQIVATIRIASASVLDDVKPDEDLRTSVQERNAAYARESLARGHYRVHNHGTDDLFKPRTDSVLSKIMDALNVDNFDRSDIQTDYFDVGHYVTLQFGDYDKPCKFI